MTKWFAVFYVVAGVAVAIFQLTNDDVSENDHINFVDIIFGVISISALWPLCFLSIAVDDFKEWYNG